MQRCAGCRGNGGAGRNRFAPLLFCLRSKVPSSGPLSQKQAEYFLARQVSLPRRV